MKHFVEIFSASMKDDKRGNALEFAVCYPFRNAVCLIRGDIKGSCDRQRSEVIAKSISSL